TTRRSEYIKVVVYSEKASLLQNGGAKAIVGAPLSNVSSRSGAERFIRYGEVYRCEYTGSQSCSSIDIDNTRPEIRDGDFIEAKSGQWLGAVVYSTGKDGKAMACAPRYIQLEHYVKITLRWLLGRCLLLKDDLSGHLNRKWILNPCENEPKSNRDFGYCEAGFSAEYMKDPPYSAVMMVDPDNPLVSPTKTTQDQIDRFEYNGYSIASGIFSVQSSADVAIGAPMEGEDGSGAVYIYHGSSKGIKLPYSQKIVGSLIEPGIKMFGISVAGNVDVDKNGYPDIVVGAYASDKAVLISVSVTVNLNYEDVISSSATSDLHLTFTFDLDKDIDVQLRRMFFYDEVTKSKVVFLKQNTTLGQPNTNYEVLRKTAYIKSKNELGDLTSLLPFDVTLSQPQPPCANNMCPILNDRMATSERVTKSFGIKFSPGSVKEDFVVQVETSSTTKQDQVVYQGPVRSEEEVKKDLDSIGPEIVQTLSVRNNGPSDLRSSEVVVNFPKAYSSSKPDSYLLYLLLLDGASGICDASVNPLKIKELDSPKAVELVTSAKIKTTVRPASTAAQEKKTPWWIILLSVLGGLLLVAAVIAILYKCGFFKRKRAKDISAPMGENVPMNDQ
ncbi:Integrin alpha-9, partial [Acropora cervicornis]